MAGISDAIVIGCVLGLVFAAVSYYLYSRTVQLEKKVGLMENILLDLKVTTEQALMMEVQDTHVGHVEREEHDEHNEQDEQNEETTELSAEDVREISVDSPRSRTPSASPSISVTREGEQQQTVNVNYEANTYKELLQVAKQKGVTGGSHMTKSELIAAIRRRDSGQPIKDIPAAWASLLEVTSNQLKVKKDEGELQEVEAADDSSNDQGAVLDDDEVDSSFVE